MVRLRSDERVTSEPFVDFLEFNRVSCKIPELRDT